MKLVRYDDISTVGKELVFGYPVDVASKWKEDWQSNSVTNKNLISDPTIRLPGFNLQRPTWSTLNRFCTGQGRCAANYTNGTWPLRIGANVATYRRWSTSSSLVRWLGLLMVTCFGSILLMMVQSRGCKMLQRRHSKWTNQTNILTFLQSCNFRYTLWSVIVYGT